MEYYRELEIAWTILTLELLGVFSLFNLYFGKHITTKKRATVVFTLAIILYVCALGEVIYMALLFDLLWQSTFWLIFWLGITIGLLILKKKLKNTFGKRKAKLK